MEKSDDERLWDERQESDYFHNQQGQVVTRAVLPHKQKQLVRATPYAARGLHFDLDDWLGARQPVLSSKLVCFHR